MNEITGLARLARAEIVLILSLLFLAVFYFAVIGRIRMAGLLRSKTTGELDPGRLQLFVVTAFLAFTLLVQMDRMRAAGTISLPENTLLFALGGSQGVYLVRKLLQVRSSSSKGE